VNSGIHIVTKKEKKLLGIYAAHGMIFKIQKNNTLQNFLKILGKKIFIRLWLQIKFLALRRV
jgi:hypothetical protein